jgi:hypothetical protein
MSDEEQKMIDYIVVCVNEFANRSNLHYKDAFNYLKCHQAIKFLQENYEIERTLGIEDAVDDLYKVAQNNGGKLLYIEIND